MADMSLQDYAAMRELESGHKKGWGESIALYIIGFVILLAILVWAWNKMNTEKTEIAVGLANIAGRVNALEPAVTSQGNNIYKLNGVVSSTVQGVGDLKECTNDKLDFLENQILFQRGRGGCGGGCGNREFRQTSTYNLASTNVTVDETCRS
jgi:hypothetical protein